MTKNSDRLPQAPRERLTFLWNGRPVEARAGDSLAAALHAAGVRAVGRSRKFHRPLGPGGVFVAGMQAHVEGVPNCRLDRIEARAGLRAAAQNVWPCARFDLLRLARLLPRRRLRAGFEHPRWLPSGTRRFELWERFLRFVAGGGNPPPIARGGEIVMGRRVQVDLLVVGGGPAGRRAAIAAAGDGRSVLLVSRGREPGGFARAMGAALPELPASVGLLAGHELAALYRQGGLAVATPHDGGPAKLIEAKRVALATGRRSIPPLAPGADLPGVMDLGTAVALLARGIRPGHSVVLVGTGDLAPTAARLEALGARIVEIAPASAVERVIGDTAVQAVDLAGRRVVCDALIHAGPWRADPALPFQASAEGEFRLTDSALPPNVEILGDAALPPEPVAGGAALDDRAFVCACMDVTVAEIRALVAKGETHVEVLKRLTGCGMGPCQGTPCWDYLAAALAELTGAPVETHGHPSYRPPRGGITLGQAAGLADLVEPEP
jgi:NADPH-dependent 2,4-dienoyl-CoA reductase/sulfur reductase-like enzyme